MSRFYFHFPRLTEIWIPHSIHSGADDIMEITFGLLLSFFFNPSFSSFTRSVKHISALLKLKTNLSRADRKKVKDTLPEILAENVCDGARVFFSTFEVKWAVSDKFSSARVSHLTVGLYSVGVCVCACLGVYDESGASKFSSCNKQTILFPFLLLRMLRRLRGDGTTALCYSLVHVTAK